MKINTKQISDVANKSEKIGNSCLANYESSKKLEFAKTSISAFRNVLYANSLLIKANK